MNLRPFLFAIMWLACSTVLFCLPGNRLPAAGWMGGLHLDKWVHIAIFFLLFLLWYRALKLGPGLRAGLLVLALIAYGMLMEWVQERFVVNRSFDVFDILADGAGAVLGWIWKGYKKINPCRNRGRNQN